MKLSRDSMNKQSKQGFSKKPRPEIRDDMDSRKNKEVNYKDPNNKEGKPSKKEKDRGINMLPEADQPSS